MKIVNIKVTHSIHYPTLYYTVFYSNFFLPHPGDFRLLFAIRQF